MNNVFQGTATNADNLGSRPASDYVLTSGDVMSGVLQLGAGSYVTTSQREPYGSILRVSNIKEYKFDWIWDKKSAGNIMVAKYQPLKNTENISVFSKGKCVYNPIFEYNHKDRTHEKPTVQKSNLISAIKSGKFITSCKNKPADARYPKNIIEISKQSTECHNSKSVHPTQKPVSLLKYLIQTHSNEGDVILDFTMGSGSTGVACLETNRKFIGIEKDEKYFNIAYNRINDCLNK